MAAVVCGRFSARRGSLCALVNIWNPRAFYLWKEDAMADEKIDRGAQDRVRDERRDVDCD